MKEIILLTKVLLKGSASNTKKTDTKLISKFFTFITFLFVYIYLAGLMSYMTYKTLISLRMFNQEEIFLNVFFMGLLGYSIFQTIFTSLNVLFFSKDIEALLPLPIKSYKVVMAKFNCLIISQYIMYVVIALPTLGTYGYLCNMGVLYYIYSLLILLVFPIVPVVIISLVVTIIMKFTNIIKNKETVQYITTVLTILFIIAIQFAFGSGNEDFTKESYVNGLAQFNSTFEDSLAFFPTVKSSILMLENYENIEAVKNLVALLVESFAIYIATSTITSKFYIKTITSIMNRGTKIRKKDILNREYKKNRTIKTYLNKEIKNLVRNPIFFMQCVVPPFLFPLIFLLPSIIALSKQGAETAVLLEFLNSYANTSVGLVASLEVAYIFYIFNFATITSISRDGSDAKVMKYLPIDLSRQLTYKSILGILFNIVPLIYITVIIAICLKMEVLTLIYFIIIAILINIFNNIFVTIIDLKNPKTDWMTEYAVVKQNLNMFYQMLIIVTQMGLLYLAVNISNLNACFITLSMIFIILIILVKTYINKNKMNLFKKIY